MEIWFTSDEHYNHQRIIEYCNRPFKNVIEMNEALVTNFNSVVKQGDLVYHLGDFAFKNHKLWLRQLNGCHYLIKGNHEGSDWKDAGFGWVKDVATVRCPDKQDVFLSHFAHRIWSRAHYGVWHLYGHSHGELPDLYKSCDVGVDAWNYFPVSYTQLKEKFSGVENLKHH